MVSSSSKIYNNREKIEKNRCKIGVGKRKAKNWKKIGFGRVLGSIWEGFGTIWGVSWTLLGASWAFFRPSKSYLFEALVQDRLQEAFWIDFDGFWKGFGRIWGGFGEAFGRIWELVGRLGADLTRVCRDLPLLEHIL